ncbi:MAG: DUF4038 domain-containing protein [Bacteroidota bacterium]
MKKIVLISFVIVLSFQAAGSEMVSIWDKFEIALKSESIYQNPLYEVADFYALMTAPSGRNIKINGFWDGEDDWKIRFMPDEEGHWSYLTFCSDTTNGGLHGLSGSFDCTGNENRHAIYNNGRITREKGNYHLNHDDGTPFFWQACTAWNGGLKSTPEEWEHYLKQRAEHGYNVIQLVGTQWRGCDQNSEGEVAFTGSGRITLNPGFFRHFDEKMDRINAHGHMAGLVLLWALPFGTGMELSPGYYLPDREAILLARYMVARYGAHHVTWLLGGDGKFYAEMEDRWMHIGREVFRDKPQGLSTLHPHGHSWIGGIYGDEDWFDIDGYQSSHGTGEGTVNFINHTVAEGWKKNSPKPVINLEPCYEQIRNAIFEDDVRNACYWSVFATPPSGITYGADGIWPWIREGEKPLNHGYTSEVSTWDRSIELPGSMQIGYLGDFIRSFKWWDLLPAQELLLEQPGEENFKYHISVLKSKDHKQILVYYPRKLGARFLLPAGATYRISWFNPGTNEYKRAYIEPEGRILEAHNPFEKDAVLVLTGAE